ncbi:hypothetical protein M422DRAFT_254102 [Sphaerobolus stellatus SS14]|uniref:Uncharacterized protein n=1 Tax=Sphaerobolus stellatus (strain SS14) TaxID=990650 RepID=A0A0C9V6P9_SPHS4|nr:hypothetical protein M422DRAFT_254102 [Sphaerobolus stellatus SS14]
MKKCITTNNNHSIIELQKPTSTVLGECLSLASPRERASALAIQWAALASTDPEMVTSILPMLSLMQWPPDCPQLHPLVKWLSVMQSTHENMKLSKEMSYLMCAVGRPPAADFRWGLDYGVTVDEESGVQKEYFWIVYDTQPRGITVHLADIEWLSHLLPYYIMDNLSDNFIMLSFLREETKVYLSERCLADSSPIVAANGALALALQLREQVERSVLTIKDKSAALDPLLEQLALKLPEYQPATKILMSLQQEEPNTIVCCASIIRVFTDFFRRGGHDRYTDTERETLLLWALDIFLQCRSLQQNPNFDKAILGFIISLHNLMGPYQPYDWRSSFVHCQLDAQWNHILEYSLTVPEEDHEAVADSFCLLGTIKWTGKDLTTKTLENLMVRITHGLAPTQPQSVRHTALTATYSLRSQIMEILSKSVCRKFFEGLLTSLQNPEVEDVGNESEKISISDISHSRQLFSLRILHAMLKYSNIATIVTQEHIASALSGISDCMHVKYNYNAHVNWQGLPWMEAFSHSMDILSMILNLDSRERNLNPSISTIPRAWEIFFDSFHKVKRIRQHENNALIALHNRILESIHLVSVYTQQSIKAQPTATAGDLTWLLDSVKGVRDVLKEYNEVRNEDMVTLVEIQQQLGVLTGLWTRARRDLEDTLSAIEEQNNAQLQAQ